MNHQQKHWIRQMLHRVFNCFTTEFVSAYSVDDTTITTYRCTICGREQTEYYDPWWNLGV